MKRYKSFILFGALALSFAACSTDDLEQNIDTLTSRVESVEAQVQALNNNMNVIRVLLDGNKTIQTATEDQATGTWTLLLSNGETLTLTPGNTDNTTYPVIEISEDGYWVIEGVKSERRAKADDGKAADITPQFQIVEKGGDKVWQVSYDEGATWEYVTDETGAYVLATGTGEGTNPIENAEVEGNNFKITLTDGSIEYMIPIVEDLVCQIMDPEDMENGKWYVDGTKSFTVTVSKSADITARVVAPAEWKATMTGSGAERTVSVTAPSTPSECILVVEVTKGVNTVTDEIVVRTNVTADGYYADFMAGLDIQIGNVKINKKMFDDSDIHVIENETSITEPGGVYFIESGVSVSYDNTGSNALKLVFIGEGTKGNEPTLKVNRQLRIAETSGAEGLFFCYNVKIDATEVYNVPTPPTSPSTTYLLAQNGNTAFKNVAFGNCEIELSKTQQPLSYISSNSRSYGNFVIENCKIKYPEAKTDQRYIISVGSSTATYGTLTFRNNVFYCAAENGLLSNFKLFNGNSATISNLVLENNTFINTGSSTTSYVYADEVGDVQVRDNLFFANNGNINNLYMVFRTTDAIPGSVSEHNIGYRSDQTTQGWRMFYQSGGVSCGWDGASDIEKITSNPFDGGTFNLEEGIFTPNATYAGYGATLE